MTDEGRDRALAAIWKGVERIATALERLSADRLDQARSGEVPPKTDKPEQPPLPGMPADDWTPPDMTPPPRIWSNTVKVYQTLWCKCGEAVFDLAELVENDAIRSAITGVTGGKIGVASYSRVLSTLHRAGAVSKKGRSAYITRPPTPEILEEIERVAKKRKEVAA